VTIGRSRSLAEELAMRRFSETFSGLKVLSIEEVDLTMCSDVDMAMVGLSRYRGHKSCKSSISPSSSSSFDPKSRSTGWLARTLT
jgi:hypothetical protein